MRRKTIIAMVLTWILCFCMCMPILAAETDSAGNIFKAEEAVNLSDIPFFGALILGQDVNVNQAAAKGSVGACGRNVTISGSSIDETLYAGGQTVDLKDVAIKGNLFAAGKDVILSGQTSCNGAYIAGDNMTFEGTTNNLSVAGNSIKISGTVNGDAFIRANKVEISPDMVVTGELKISSEEEPEIPETAQIGNYVFEKEKKEATENGENEEKAEEEKPQSTVSPLAKKIKKTIYWFAAMAALGMIMCWLFNSHLTRACEYLTTRTGPFIGSGIGGFFLIPIIAVLLCITFILAPVGVISLIVYAILIFASIAFAGASLPRLFLPRLNIFLSTLIGVAVLQILRMIPFIGTLVGIVAAMYMLGYVIQYVWNNRLKRSKG